MTRTQTLPYAPLTHAELNERSTQATLDAGYRTRSILRDGREYTPRDLTYLSRAAARAEEWHAAAMARC